MPRVSSPYKQTLNKDKEPVFYEIKEFSFYLTGEKMLSNNTATSYETDLTKYCEYLKNIVMSMMCLISKKKISKLTWQC